MFRVPNSLCTEVEFSNFPCDVQYVYHLVVISILHQTYHISHLTLRLGQGQIITYDDNLKPIALMLSQI